MKTITTMGRTFTLSRVPSEDGYIVYTCQTTVRDVAHRRTWKHLPEGAGVAFEKELTE